MFDLLEYVFSDDDGSQANDNGSPSHVYVNRALILGDESP